MTVIARKNVLGKSGYPIHTISVSSKIILMHESKHFGCKWAKRVAGFLIQNRNRTAKLRNYSETTIQDPNKHLKKTINYSIS